MSAAAKNVVGQALVTVFDDGTASVEAPNLHPGVIVKVFAALTPGLMDAAMRPAEKVVAVPGSALRALPRAKEDA